MAEKLYCPDLWHKWIRKMGMRLFKYILIIAPLLLSACSNDEQQAASLTDKSIKIELSGGERNISRAYLINGNDAIYDKGEFTLDAYNNKDNSIYINEGWIYLFNGNWRFRDVVNQGNLIDFYWPNDNDVNFLAYLPHDLSKSVVKREDITYDTNEGVKFSAEMPTVIDYATKADTIAENLTRQEFIYACRLNQNYESDEGHVKLRFVHPFAVINFHLLQAHRDLTINSITLHNVDNRGLFTCIQDTYEYYKQGNEGQEYLTHDNWDTENPSTFAVNLNKTVPEDGINYESHLGGPFMVIPQNLDGITLSVNYSWDTKENEETNKVYIKTEGIPYWEPGKRYTYLLNLGDNLEEILFKVIVEPWDAIEDDGYENKYDVK